MLRSGAVLSVVAMACGGPSLGFTELGHELQRARCEHLTRCGLFADEPSCNAYFRDIPADSLAGAVAAGVVRYDGEQAQRCVDSIARQGCDASNLDGDVEPIDCLAMFSGTVAGGAACSINEECSSGTCNLPSECPSTGCCVGTCRPTQAPGKTGDGCGRATDCGEGLVCGRDLSCHIPAGDGSACGSNRECADGFGCVGQVAAMPGTCRALPHLGQACPYRKCAGENLRCDADSGTCVALGLPGDPCPTSIECSPYLECDRVTHTCRTYPTLGMPCLAVCGGDAFCSVDELGHGTCVAPRESSAPCDGYLECASYYCEQGPLFDSCKSQYVCF